MEGRNRCIALKIGISLEIINGLLFFTAHIAHMNYQVLGYNSEDRENPVSLSTPVDAASYLETQKCQDLCCLVLVAEERFQLVLDNFQEWETELLEQAQAALLWRNPDFTTAMQQRLTLDRRFVNLLTSLRLYLDQSDHNLSHIFGDNSAELIKIKGFKNKLYDDHFGFRLIEALRNHVQHSALPLSAISYNEKRVESKDGFFVQSSVVPKISYDALAENPKFKKSVLEEIKAQGRYTDLRLSAREYIFCLTQLHFEMRGTLKECFSISRATYEKAIEKFSEIGGRKVKHVRLEALDESGRVVGRVEFVDNFLKLYDVLFLKNSKVIDIRRNFASNALHEN